MTIERNKELADELSFKDVFEILAIQCASQVQDMVSDYLCDPDYVRDEGMPSKQKMFDMVVAHAIDVIPAVMEDQLPKIDSLTLPDLTKHSELEKMLITIMAGVIQGNPKLLKIEFQPK